MVSLATTSITGNSLMDSDFVPSLLPLLQEKRAVIETKRAIIPILFNLILCIFVAFPGPI
jgi:hypothetical protein